MKLRPFVNKEKDNMFYSDCKKVDHVKATSKTWTQTLDPDPEKPGLRKTWSMKNLDSEKPGP